MSAQISYRNKGKEAAPKQGTVICTCFGITDEEIRRVVAENKLTTVEGVTNYCKAGGGCGGCHAEIEKIIEDIQGDKADVEHTKHVKKPAKLTNIMKIQLVQETINEQIRPALRADGGDIDLIDVDGNKVIVAFRGMCAQCRSSDFTMKDVVEAKLREFVSDELYVEQAKESQQD